MNSNLAFVSSRAGLHGRQGFRNRRDFIVLYRDNPMVGEPDAEVALLSSFYAFTKEYTQPYLLWWIRWTPEV